MRELKRSEIAQVFGGLANGLHTDPDGGAGGGGLGGGGGLSGGPAIVSVTSIDFQNFSVGTAGSTAGTAAVGASGDATDSAVVGAVFDLVHLAQGVSSQNYVVTQTGQSVSQYELPSDFNTPEWQGPGAGEARRAPATPTPMD